MKNKNFEFNFQKFLHSKHGSFLAIIFSLSIIYGIGFIYTNQTQQIESQEVLSKVGSRGDEVRRIQNKLKSLGFFNGTVDGIYGTKTQSAVKRYQQSVGITADGVAGPKTLLYLGLGSSSGGSTGGYSSSDVYLLAKVIAAEARGESYTGQVAVGAVVMNRVRSSLFPDTVAGVIYQKKQFSPVGSGRFAIVLARGANASCYEAAQEAMAGSSPVGNCLFFRTPIPGLTGIQIGGHIFY